jgi:hypothetical protein
MEEDIYLSDDSTSSVTPDGVHHDSVETFSVKYPTQNIWIKYCPFGRTILLANLNGGELQKLTKTKTVTINGVRHCAFMHGRSWKCLKVSELEDHPVLLSMMLGFAN